MNVKTGRLVILTVGIALAFLDTLMSSSWFIGYLAGQVLWGTPESDGFLS